MGKQPLPETSTVNATPEMTPEAARIFEVFQKKQDSLTREFRRELAKLAKQPLPPDDQEEATAGVQDSSSNSSSSEDRSSSNDDDNDDEMNGAVSSSEDEDPNVPLPPPADPDKPSARAKLQKLEVQALKAKKPKPKSKKGRGKGNKKNADKKSKEINGVGHSPYPPGFIRFPPAGAIMGMKADGTMVNGEGVNGEKKERVRASKNEFKRLDELYVFLGSYLDTQCLGAVVIF